MSRASETSGSSEWLLKITAKNESTYRCFINVKKWEETSRNSLSCSLIMVEIWVHAIMRAFEIWIFTSITITSTRIRFLKIGTNWIDLKLVVLGATLLPDDWSNIGKKNMARRVSTPKKNSKWHYSIYQGNVGKNIFVFWESGRNFNLFFFSNSIFTCLTLNMPRQIKKLLHRMVLKVLSVNFHYCLIFSGFNFQPPFWKRLCC